MESMDELTAFANELADLAREGHREIFERPPEVTIKGDGSPVTALDVATEDRIRARIVERYPEHGIIGEERERRNPEAELSWIIDPIDGTKSFVAGVPLYTVLIGLARGGELILGAVDQPILETRWVGGVSVPTRRDGVEVRSRREVALEDAFIAMGSYSTFGERREDLMRLTDRARWTLVGRDSFLAGLVASGRLDGLVLDGMNLYDFAALAPIVEGAGGVALNERGERLGLGRARARDLRGKRRARRHNRRDSQRLTRVARARDAGDERE